MISVITADIINSRSIGNPDVWILPLKSYLARFGPTPKKWEIYRGDSFQLEVDDPFNALQSAIHMKAIIKSKKELDLRMAIGLGDKTYEAGRITEANGSAFVRSGGAFENLKKNTTLAIASGSEAFDEEMNLYLKFANIIMNGWKPATAEIVNAYLNNPELSQAQLGELIGMTQPSVSDALSRANYYELMELVTYYKKRLKQQIDKK